MMLGLLLKDIEKSTLAEFFDKHGQFEDFLLAELVDERLDLGGSERPGEAGHRLNDFTSAFSNAGLRRDGQWPIDELTVLVIAKA